MSRKAVANHVVKEEYRLFLPESARWSGALAPHFGPYRTPSAADKPSISDVSVHNSLLLPAVDDGREVS